MMVNLLRTGYGDINLQVPAEGHNYTKSKVTLLESLFLSFDWDKTMGLQALHNYYYGVHEHKDIAWLQISSENVIQLLKVGKYS